VCVCENLSREGGGRDRYRGVEEEGLLFLFWDCWLGCFFFF